MRADIHQIITRLLAPLGLDHLFTVEGPTPQCWERWEQQMMSGGELVMLGLALAIADYSAGGKLPKLDRLMILDNSNLRAAGEALIALTMVRGGKPLPDDYAKIPRTIPPR
jgi:hypothetical protein